MVKKLKADESIIIKPADKGSSMVIMDKQDYIQEGNRQLEVDLHYRKLPEAIHPAIRDRLQTIVDQLVDQGALTEAEGEYFAPPLEPRERRFYLLPKIHKDPNTWKAAIPPGRPIVSDCSSDTYRLAELVDYFLTPLSFKHPAYVQDTYDFIQKIGKIKINPNALLISMDVEALYTNIDNKEGIQAVANTFLKFPDPDRPDKEILELLEIQLSQNDFRFNNEWYLQQWGTSMGKKFAPGYANIFMAEFEDKALQKCTKKPAVYLRYLDDIFIIWEHSEEDFKEFLTILNSSHPTIKLSPTISKQAIDFLDITIYKGPRTAQTGTLDTKVFFKPTDTHELLHKWSFHPKHTFRGIVKSQFLRFHRISSNPKDFNQAASTLTHALTRRGYSRRMLREIKNDLLQSITPTQNLAISRPCGQSRCKTCNNMETTCHFRDKGLTHNLDCASANVIYAITCKNCQEVYIGETARPLRDRMNNHRSDIRNKANTTLAIHMHHCFPRGGDTGLMFKVTGLEQIKVIKNEALNRLELHKRETHWMKETNSISPHGINKKEEITNFLPLILKFSDWTPKISQLFQIHYHELVNKFPAIFKTKILTAHCRNKNLLDLLTSSKIPGEPKYKPTTTEGARSPQTRRHKR
jgi:hypothetical protein